MVSFLFVLQGDIGEQLSIGDNFTSLFTNVNRVQNPFASSSRRSRPKLSLLKSYKEVEKDDHGKGSMAFLDTSFEFVDFDFHYSDAGGNLVVDDMTTTFSDELRTNLVASIAINEYFENIFENRGEDRSFFSEVLPPIADIGANPVADNQVVVLELCQGDCNNDDECAEGLECFQRGTGGPQPTGCIGTPTIDNDYCVVKDEGLRLGVIPYFKDISDIQKVLVGGKFTGFLNTKKNQWITPHPTLAEPHRRFTRSFLDASIAAIFGEKTSIGQVCSFAQGLKDDNVITVPGFCCLDAPYEADYWGELVRNILLCKLKSTK
jgi:hypothetical protein